MAGISKKNVILSHVGFIVVPLKKGNQWIIPTIIEKNCSYGYYIMNVGYYVVSIIKYNV
jgi:hypothetical protein